MGQGDCLRLIREGNYGGTCSDVQHTAARVFHLSRRTCLPGYVAAELRLISLCWKVCGLATGAPACICAGYSPSECTLKGRLRAEYRACQFCLQFGTADMVPSQEFVYLLRSWVGVGVVSWERSFACSNCNASRRTERHEQSLSRELSSVTCHSVTHLCAINRARGLTLSTDVAGRCPVVKSVHLVSNRAVVAENTCSTCALFGMKW